MSTAMTAESLNVILAEDDPDLADSLGLTVESLGHKMVWFSQAEPVLKEVKSRLCLPPAQRFQLLMTDITLFGLTGLELAEEVRKLDDEIVIVLVSGSATLRNTFEKYNKSGIVDGYLSKPFGFEPIETILKKVPSIRDVTRSLTQAGQV